MYHILSRLDNIENLLREQTTYRASSGKKMGVRSEREMPRDKWRKSKNQELLKEQEVQQRLIKVVAALNQGSAAAAQVAAIVQEYERRYDTDGELYTKAEFVGEYGGAAEWEAAKPDPEGNIDPEEVGLVVESLWSQGNEDQARKVLRRAIEDAVSDRRQTTYRASSGRYEDMKVDKKMKVDKSSITVSSHGRRTKVYTSKDFEKWYEDYQIEVDGRPVTPNIVGKALLIWFALSPNPVFPLKNIVHAETDEHGAIWKSKVEKKNDEYYYSAYRNGEISSVSKINVSSSHGRIIDQNVHEIAQTNWKIQKNTYSLTNKEKTKTISGEYVFEPSTMKLTYFTRGKMGVSTALIVECGKYDFVNIYNNAESELRTHGKPLSHYGIHQIIGSINKEIAHKKGRRQVYVLPSQLNAAEYPSQKIIVSEVNAYKYDMTGGPRGQLAGDPAVAQFILDNAANDKNDGGINNIRSMDLVALSPAPEGTKNVTLQNGYLIHKGLECDRTHFLHELQKMTIFGMQDINVTGIVSEDYNEFANGTHTVDMIYASAMPLSPEYGVKKTSDTLFLAKMVLLGQYIASMKWAIERQNCDLILMPLGGGVFKNSLQSIKIAIVAAYTTLKTDLHDANVNVKVLAFEKSGDEIQFFK